MTEMFSQQGEKVEFEKPVEAKGAAARPKPSLGCPDAHELQEPHILQDQ
jgi:hypothetical protein